MGFCRPGSLSATRELRLQRVTEVMTEDWPSLQHVVWHGGMREAYRAGPNEGGIGPAKGKKRPLQTELEEGFV